MSKQSTSEQPAPAAASSAPCAPPAGPESTVKAPCAAAPSALVRPPEDSITAAGGRPICALRAASFARCPRRSGESAASSSVVAPRSYSRGVELTSCDSEMCTSGSRRRSASRRSSG